MLSGDTVVRGHGRGKISSSVIGNVSKLMSEITSNSFQDLIPPTNGSLHVHVETYIFEASFFLAIREIV